MGVEKSAQSFVVGSTQIKGRPVPLVASGLTPADRLGAMKVRWGIGRYDYLVVPGLYGMGNPDENSPVFVSANYKLSFDVLRSALDGIDCFILVLETMGINVWCAAGKKTFGTGEIILRVAKEVLSQVVAHRRLVVPQLGAPGVEAHIVKSQTGFRVIYGPVDARDIRDFVQKGYKGSGQMRIKKFPLGERAALIPMELVPSCKWGVPALLVMGCAGAFWGNGSWEINIWREGLLAALAVVIAVIAGTVCVPLLLPFLPGRSFSVKGALGGLVLSIGASGIAAQTVFSSTGEWSVGYLSMMLGGLCIFAMAGSSFLAMNFTGSSTYTSLSGVEKEMKVAVPLQVIGAALGLCLWIGALIGF